MKNRLFNIVGKKLLAILALITIIATNNIVLADVSEDVDIQVYVQIAPPTNTSAGCRDTAGLELSWEDSLHILSGGLAGYHIYGKKSSEASYVLLTTVNVPTAPNANLTTPQVGESWDFLVRAFDEGGNESREDCESCKLENHTVIACGTAPPEDPDDGGGGGGGYDPGSDEPPEPPEPVTCTPSLRPQFYSLNPENNAEISSLNYVQFSISGGGSDLINSSITAVVDSEVINLTFTELSNGDVQAEGSLQNSITEEGTVRITLSANNRQNCERNYSYFVDIVPDAEAQEPLPEEPEEPGEEEPEEPGEEEPEESGEEEPEESGEEGSEEAESSPDSSFSPTIPSSPASPSDLTGSSNFSCLEGYISQETIDKLMSYVPDEEGYDQEIQAQIGEIIAELEYYGQEGVQVSATRVQTTLEKLDSIFEYSQYQDQEEFFSDLEENTPIYEAVYSLYDRRLIMSSEEFRPEDKITRSEYVKIAMGATNCLNCANPTAEEKAKYSNVQPFPDVSPNSWYYFCIIKSKALGVVQGFGDGYFRPDENITRAQAVAILLRQSGMKLDEQASKPLKDVPEGAWYKEEVYTAYNLGLISDKDGNVYPEEKINRGEFAIIADKFLEFKDCKLIDSDNDGMPDYWEESHNLDANNSSDGLNFLVQCLLGAPSEIEVTIIPEEEEEAIYTPEETQYQLVIVPEDESVLPDALNNLTSSGIKDSDQDGLSDGLEAQYGTDPNNKDTDGDGATDGEEVLELGTDPLVPDQGELLATIANWRDNDKTGESSIFVKGAGPANQMMEIVAIDENNKTIRLGSALVDAEGKYILPSEVELLEGKYTLHATAVDVETRNVIKESRPVKIIVADDFALPSPQVLAINDNYLEADQVGKFVPLTVKEIIIKDGNVIVRGNTYYGSTVHGTFQSILTSASVIADSPAGDFELISPRKLEPGEHKVILYAITPDNIKSETLTIPFKIDDKYIFVEEGSLEMFFYLLILISFIISSFYFIRRRQENKATKQETNIKTKND